jgi:SAM-dependent methyltransferase
MHFLRRFFYNLWYYRKPPWDTGISPPELIEFIEMNSPGRALDLGCGTGTNVITLAENNWEVVGIDFANRAITSARRKIKGKGLKTEFHIGDVTNLSFLQGKFDLILDIGCFHTLKKDEKVRYTQNLLNYLADGGYFLLYGWIKEPNQKGTGIFNADLLRFSKFLKLNNREEGTEGGKLPSVWLTYQK